MKTPFRTLTLRELACGLFGASVIMYFPVVGVIKVVDLGTLTALCFLARKIHRLGLALMALCAAVFLAYISTVVQVFFASRSGPNTLVTALSSVAALLACFTVANMTAIQLVRFAQGFVASTITVSIIAMAQAFNVIPKVLPQYQSVFGSSPLGTMPDPSRFGFVLVAALCFVLAALAIGKKRLLNSANFLVLAFMIVMTGQRAAVLVSGVLIAASACYFAATHRRADGRLGWRPAGILAVALMLSVGTAVDLLQPRFLEGGHGASGSVALKFAEKGFSYTDDPRFEKLLAGFSIVADKPAIGYGFDGYVEYANAGSSHNTYIQFLTAGGIFALLFFFVFLGLCFHNVCRSVLHNACERDVDWLIVGRGLLFLALLIYMMIMNLNYLAVGYALLGAVVNRQLTRSAVPRSSNVVVDAREADNGIRCPPGRVGV